MKNIVVVGGGEVFLLRYLPALCLTDFSRLRISAVLDICDADMLSIKIREICPGSAISVYQSQSSEPNDLISLIEKKNLLEHPIIISTPTALHVPFSLALLKRGCSICIEKPLTANRHELSLLHNYLRFNGAHKLFLFGYYALEKGLPLFALGHSGKVPEQYYRQINPPCSEPQLRDIRQSLGNVCSIQGVLLEGSGPAGVLAQRPWVLDPKNGGNTVETFYHLVVMCLPFIPPLSLISCHRVVLACHRPTSDWYEDRFHSEAAETYTHASMRTSDGIEIMLTCSKYVPPTMHQRWMKIIFDHGYACMNFENNQLLIATSSSKCSFELKPRVKYVTQFNLWADKLDDPSMHTEYDLFSRALLQTFDIRDVGMQGQKRYYDESTLTQLGLEKIMAGDI